ncbi:2Fe-2S iron-sulfur cluster binding domain-containing protein [Streptomyces sp. NPDC096057]|uniref:2Fe-2S iron-sulfur cluster-binding protein n=1 Tax=Streptomyces sp. NPDC096057 TaxID=3155543 RepID=UPI00331EB78A
MASGTGLPATGSSETVGHRFTVELGRTGVSVEVAADETILAAIAPYVPDLSYNCLEGECGTCVQTVLAGTPLHRDHVLSARARTAGKRIMICVSRASSDRLVLDL